MSQKFSPALARRIALSAQGFGRAAPAAVGTRQINTVLDRLSVLQIDSVNVFERSHYLPVFARLGAYDKTLLDRLTFRRGTRFIEYWAHQAAFIPVEDWPLFRWRMDRFRHKYREWADANATMLVEVKAQLAARGPLAASQIEHEANVRRGPWWGWSDVKRALEMLFFFGEVATAGRTRFERTYALTEQIVSAELLGREVSKHDAVRQLVSRSGRALGIATLTDIADYYRLLGGDAKSAVADLVDSGELVPVTVGGWDRAAYLHRDTRLPRRVETAALLSPFDPIVWRRERAERLFDFTYRIEIYTPAPQRVYGYYVLPVLMDDRIVGRVDLKSDRQAGVLRVQAAWSEPGATEDAPERLAALLRETASWQGLDGVEVAERGSMSGALSSALQN